MWLGATDARSEYLCKVLLQSPWQPTSPHPPHTKPSHRWQQQQQHPPIRLPSKWAVSIGTGQLPFDDGSHEVTPADSASSSESPAGRRGRERGLRGGRWVDGWMLTERNDEKRGRLSLLTQLRHSSSSLWAAQSWFQLLFFGDQSGVRTPPETR